jgi:hypothetical protein
VTTVLIELQQLREQIKEKDALLKEAAECLEVAWARIEHQGMLIDTLEKALKDMLEEYRG